MILLFLKIYKKKDLSTELIKVFKEINESPKENEKNMDRKSFLKDYTSKFESIISEADQLIENYNTIEFYGIILCYLNYYDFENFMLITNKLFKNKSKEIFEILLIYKDNFKYPIKQKWTFFINLLVILLKGKMKMKL